MFSRAWLMPAALPLAGLLLGSASFGAGTQEVPPLALPLTVDGIMRGPELVGYPPRGLRWSGDSGELLFEWRRPGEREESTWAIATDASEPRRLSDEERRRAPPPTGVWDRARRRVLFVEDGDIVLIDSVARTRRWITRTTATEGRPRWARDETHVTFVRDNNLFIVPLEGDSAGVVVQLTDVKPPDVDEELTDSQRFLRDEEERLIEWAREAAERRKRDEERRRERALPAFAIDARQSVDDLALAPGGRYVWMLVVERPAHARPAHVPRFVSESGYTEDEAARTKVGDEQALARLAILDLETGGTVWADEAFAGESEEPVATAGATGEGAAGLRERRVIWRMPLFATDGGHAVASARATDNKDRWLVRVDPASGESRVVDHLHDPAWIREVGGFDPQPGSNYGWMPDDRRVWFLSERDGWMHLYVVDASAAGAEARQLTAGSFELSSAVLSPDGRTFYLVSNEEHPGERHTYAMPSEGGDRVRLTSLTGWNVGEVSPDGATIGLVHSYATQPPEVFLMANRPDAEPRQVTTTPTGEWRSVPWIDPRLVTFRARDGAEVYARLYTPEMIGARRHASSAGVVFVHGAGYLQNAHRYWSTYYREYMFHNLLAARGYVVLDVDFRASAGYGRDWRTAIYRHMGGQDLDDIVDGAKYLVDEHGVDPDRLGVYGGSYGGFITLMAMFTTPEVFAAGAALRPVTDWAHYNHPYTSNILNQPHRDPEAFRRSSPIYFAEGLQGALLICHGMADVNVHFQDSVRLAQRLIELRKENWELAVYPVEDHAFEQETSWADQYRRILRLFERHLAGRT